MSFPDRDSASADAVGGRPRRRRRTVRAVRPAVATYIVRGVGAPRSADAWVPVRLAALVLGAAAAVAVRSAAPGWTVMLPFVLVAGAAGALARRPRQPRA